MEDLITITVNQAELATILKSYLMDFLVVPLWGISCAIAFISGFNTGNR